MAQRPAPVDRIENGYRNDQRQAARFFRKAGVSLVPGYDLPVVCGIQAGSQ